MNRHSLPRFFGCLIIHFSLLAAVALLAGCDDTSPSGSAGPEWTAVTLAVEGNDVRGAFFLSSDTGWLAGVDGAIIHTTDGGRTWSKQFTGTTQTLLGIGFADGRNGWVVGDGGCIMRTTDGGRTWLNAATRSTSPLHSVIAVTSRKALTLGADSSCNYSLDGGFRWEVLTTSAVGALHDLAVIDSAAIAVGDNGLICRFSGYDRVIERLSADTVTFDPLVIDTILHTVDTLWSTVEVIPPAVDDNLVAVTHAGGGVLWAVGENGTIVTSTDTGSHWVQIPSGTTAALTDIAFYGTDGIIVGLGGAKLVTNNGGLEWTGIPGDIGLDLYCAAAPAPGILWAFGAFTILRSYDAGLTWQRLTSGTVLTSSLTDIQFLDDTLGFAVGYNGVILRTTDGGDIWRLLRQGSSDAAGEWLSAVDFIDPLYGWAVGRTGDPPYSLLVVRTEDGGNSWQSFAFPALPWAKDVAFVDHLTGYTCGLGAILQTFDGGENWQVQPIPIPADLVAIDFADPHTGLSVGAGGAVMRTGDGVVWEDRTADTLAIPMYGLHCVNALLAYAVGASGTIWKTADGGAIWLELTSPTRNDLVAVHFSDAATGTVVGADGTIISTSDGGDTWRSERAPTSASLLGVHMIGPNIGWIVGEDGTMLRKTPGAH